MILMEHINLPLPREMLKAIDEARGDVPRTVWIRRSIEARLTEQHGKESDETTSSTPQSGVPHGTD